MFQTMPKPINSEEGGKVKAGTHEDVIGTSQVFTIDTGLSSINKFVMLASKSYQSDKSPVMVALDNINYPNTFTSFKNNNNAGFYGKGWLAYTSTADTYVPVVTDVTGGVITIKTATHSALCDLKDIVWYAE